MVSAGVIFGAVTLLITVAAQAPAAQNVPKQDQSAVQPAGQSVAKPVAQPAVQQAERSLTPTILRLHQAQPPSSQGGEEPKQQSDSLDPLAVAKLKREAAQEMRKTLSEMLITIQMMELMKTLMNTMVL